MSFSLSKRSGEYHRQIVDMNFLARSIVEFARRAI